MAEKIIMIALSPTMNEGQIVSWIKKEGEFIENGEILCEVETDKAIMEYESPNEGTLLKILKKEGEKAFVGEVIAIIGKKNENISETLKTLDVKNINTKEKTSINVEYNVESKNLNEPEKSENNSKQIYSSPLARNLAHKNNLNLELIKGTGPKNRIIKRDIENVLQNKNTSTQMIIKDSFIENLEKDQLIELSQKRKIIANRLSESKYSSPHYYLTLSIKMDDLLTARKKLNDSLKKRIGLNSFLIKYLSEALKKYPMINAGFENNKIRIFSSIDIGIAVAQDDGLITPIIRNCKYKGIIQIEKELKILIDKAKSGKIKPDEFTKASFTISNLGSFGIEEFTAIINPPGAAILAIGTIKKEPIVGINNQIEIQSLMKVTLSCDHRIIDGAYGANFLNEFKLIIENPIRILF